MPRCPKPFLPRAFTGALALLGACSPKAPLGLPCDPADASYCAVWQLVCAASDAGAVCARPGEFQPCDTVLGCAPPYGCQGPFPIAPPNFFCFATCRATTDCTDPGAVCQTYQGIGTFCVENPCGPGSPADGGFFQPCGVADAGDGTCLPFPFGDAGVFGSCQAGGPVGDGGACGVDRAGGALCAVGLGCAGSGDTGVCVPLCDPLDAGGPVCAGTQRCVEEPGFNAGLCE